VFMLLSDPLKLNAERELEEKAEFAFNPFQVFRWERSVWAALKIEESEEPDADPAEPPRSISTNSTSRPQAPASVSIASPKTEAKATQARARMKRMSTRELETAFGNMTGEQKTYDPRRNFQERIYAIFRVYFQLKVMMSFIYATCVFILLRSLSCELGIVLAAISFFLNFIPELGTIIAMFLPFPFVALTMLPDGEDRLWHVTKYFLGMFVIKMIVSNWGESVVMGRHRVLVGVADDRKAVNKAFKETHPVLIIFFVVLCGEVWGSIGMLVSVPTISLIRLGTNLWSYSPDHAQ